jgi:hypothetical protein
MVNENHPKKHGQCDVKSILQVVWGGQASVAPDHEARRKFEGTTGGPERSKLGVARDRFRRRQLLERTQRGGEGRELAHTVDGRLGRPPHLHKLFVGVSRTAAKV